MITGRGRLRRRHRSSRACSTWPSSARPRRTRRSSRSTPSARQGLRGRPRRLHRRGPDDLASPLPMAWVPPGVEVKTPEHWPLAHGEVKYVGRARSRSSSARTSTASSTPPSRCWSSTSRCRSIVDPEEALKDESLVHDVARHQQDPRVVDRRRRHGRRVGRGRRRRRAAHRQPPHGRRADRAARLHRRLPRRPADACTSPARTRTSSGSSWRGELGIVARTASASSPPTSAAASASRSPTTPRRSSRPGRRAGSAGRSSGPRRARST